MNLTTYTTTYNAPPQFEFPEIFSDPSLIQGRSDALLCADALEAWATCHMGIEIPDNFGEVMVKIAKRLKCAATPDVLMEVANRFITPDSTQPENANDTPEVLRGTTEGA